MKTNEHLHPAHFFLEWEIFHTKVVEKIKTHFGFSNFFPPENRAVYEIMWGKYGRAGQATYDRIQLRRKDAHDMPDN